MIVSRHDAPGNSLADTEKEGVPNARSTATVEGTAHEARGVSSRAVTGAWWRRTRARGIDVEQ